MHNDEITDTEKYQLIENNFYNLTPLGEELIGLNGFNKWCHARKLDINITKNQYELILEKYYGKNFKAPIDFTDKLKSTFSSCSLKKYGQSIIIILKYLAKQNLALRL